MSETTDTLPSTPPADRTGIVLAPPRLLFTHSVELPQGIAPEEIPNFAEFTLEDLSPFPLEQLQWSYLSHQESGHILLCAAYRPRLRAQNAELPDQGWHILPACLSLYGLRQSEPAWFFVQHGDSLSAQLFLAHNPVPREIHTLHLNEDTNIAAVFKARDKLLARIDTHQHAVDTGIIESTGHTLGKHHEIIFHHIRFESVDSEPETLPDNLIADDSLLWQADLRDAPVKQQAKRNRRLGHYLKRGFAAAGIAACLLLVFEIAKVATTLRIESRKEYISERQPTVKEVENQQFLVQTVEKFSQAGLKPLDMLYILNEYRPNTVYFTSAEGEDNEGRLIMSVNGRGRNSADVEGYYNSLKASGHFNLIELPTNRFENGRAEFEMLLEFKPLTETTPQVAVNQP